MLKDLYRTPFCDPDNGSFRVYLSRVLVEVYVLKGGVGDSTVIEVSARLVTDVPLTPELYKWVATVGQNFDLAGVRIEPNDDDDTGLLFVQYSISGVDVDESELLNAVTIVCKVAKEEKIGIFEKFGGKEFPPK